MAVHTDTEAARREGPGALTPAENAGTWRVAAELRPSFWDGGAAYWIRLALIRADGTEVAAFREDAPGPERLAAWGRLAGAPGAAPAELELPCGAQLRRAGAYLHCIFPARDGLGVASVPLEACEAAFAALRAAFADLAARAAADQEEDTLRAVHRDVRRWCRGVPHAADYRLEGRGPELRALVKLRWAAPLPAELWCSGAGRALPLVAAPPGGG